MYVTVALIRGAGRVRIRNASVRVSAPMAPIRCGFLVMHDGVLAWFWILMAMSVTSVTVRTVDIGVASVTVRTMDIGVVSVTVRTMTLRMTMTVRWMVAVRV